MGATPDHCLQISQLTKSKTSPCTYQPMEATYHLAHCLYQTIPLQLSQF
jgi:hypothetical protein